MNNMRTKRNENEYLRRITINFSFDGKKPHGFHIEVGAIEGLKISEVTQAIGLKFTDILEEVLKECITEYGDRNSKTTPRTTDGSLVG